MHLSRNLMAVMKSSLVGTFLLLLLSCAVSGLGSVVSRSYSYIEMHYTWQEAQSYCRNSDGQSDLATFYTQSDSETLDLTSYHAWIGLYRDGAPGPGASEVGGSGAGGSGPGASGPSTSGPGPGRPGPGRSRPGRPGPGRSRPGRPRPGRSAPGVSGPGNNSWTWTKGGDLNFDPWANNESSYGKSCGYVYYTENNEMTYSDDCYSYHFFICDKSDFEAESKTWYDARQSCWNKDLANYNDQEDLNGNVHSQGFPVWIGLYRAGETWKWSAGVSDYTNWTLDETMTNGDCVTISSDNKQMATQNCSSRFPFICHEDNLVLVKENKTWEEALEYCRALSSPPQPELRYELVSVQPEDYDYLRSRVMEADTEEVWTGLRFLAGEWLWMNGADMRYSDLPLCPSLVQRCGTLSKHGTGSMETRDCAERRNFLCYSV